MAFTDMPDNIKKIKISVSCKYVFLKFLFLPFYGNKYNDNIEIIVLGIGVLTMSAKLKKCSQILFKLRALKCKCFGEVCSKNDHYKKA